jgi:tetratricopeptide (TPR) repeat protein
MGAVSLERRDPSEAIPYFRKYRELKPEEPRGRLMLGIAFLEGADLASARKELEEAAQHRETAAGAYFYLARLNRQQEKLPEALNAVEKTIELDAANAEAYAQLGLIRFRQREYDLAGKALARALELNPDSYPANFNLLMLYRRIADKRAEAQAKRFEEVKNKRTQKTQDFLRLIEIRP